ncbi:ATP-binding protein, partial [bacterium]|nr:ATP-binding protein [bacterium]
MSYRNNMITIVNLSHLKHYEIKVSNDISWEQTALDIVYGITSHPTLRNLLRSSELIVTIGSAGAVHIRSNDDPALNEYTLVFDPEFMENEWEEKNSKDIRTTVGLGSSFLAGFVSALIFKNKAIIDSIRVGLNTMTSAIVKGIYRLGEDYSFITEDLSEAVERPFRNRYYSSAFVPSPAWQGGFRYLHNQDWSILENNYDNNRPGYNQKADLFPLAFSLAENGKRELHYAPRLNLGKVTIFDRSEIENIRNIRKQVGFYDRYDDGKKPLNIAVFGPPGAGKSFIVKALANSMFDGKKTKPSFLTFNLSQFREESELSGAFHAVRDEVLRGKLPVVFWDEFDSNDYKWLKSLIAPMQDGEFQEGKEVHPIGKCIFVFAGGVTYTMKHFTDKMEETGYAVKKGPDFQSRINCSLNVFGPNRKPFTDPETGNWVKEGDPKDICFSVRRALFIRSILSSDDKRLEIDRELLRVLIEVSTFRNGSRGLERLLRNLAVHSGEKIERSDLPSKEIIQMNLDYDDFMEKLSDETTARKLAFEKIALAIHNFWLEKGVTGSVFHKRYEDLSYDQRVDNISAARRMKQVIESTEKFILISEAALRWGGLPDSREEFTEFI